MKAIAATILFFAAMATAAFALSAAESGNALAKACRAYMDNTANRDDPCRHFIMDYMTQFKAQQDLELEALLKGQPRDPNAPCIRMPDFISYGDLARLVVARIEANAGLGQGTAAELMQATLVYNFRCAEPPH
ncbi:MAG: hypothetical protein HXY22_09070 [Alphaproteobacteria bacterium]|nr:hypothetical protein [Alphaproteobacteria bacterium]